jgi:hypothetical protein
MTKGLAFQQRLIKRIPHPNPDKTFRNGEA